MPMPQKLIDCMNHIEICGGRSSYSKTDRDATFMHGKEDSIIKQESSKHTIIFKLE